MELNRVNTIKNGEIKRYTGEKQVAFDPKTGKIREVLYAVYSGFSNQQGTVQSVYDGDIIAVVSWSNRAYGKEHRLYRIYNGHKTSIPVPETGALWLMIREQNPWLDAWLEPNEREIPVFIPLDIIPEIEYLSNQRKLMHLVKCFDRFSLDYDPKDFVTSKKTDLNLIPREIDIDMNVMPFESIVTEWWGSAGTKKTPVKLDITLSNDVTEATYAVRGWKRFKHIIRIRHEIYTSKKGSFGKSIDIWKGLPLHVAKKQ